VVTIAPSFWGGEKKGPWGSMCRVGVSGRKPIGSLRGQGFWGGKSVATTRTSSYGSSGKHLWQESGGGGDHDTELKYLPGLGWERGPWSN